MKKKRDAAYLAKIETALKMHGEGRTYDEIAAALEMNTRQAAYMMIQRELKRRQTFGKEADRVQSLRIKQLRAIDSALRVMLNRAAAGEIYMANAALKLLDRQAQILGLYAEDDDDTSEAEGA